VERGQRPGGLGRPRHQDLASEMVEDRLQPGGVGQLVEVGEGTFTELPDGEMFLSLSGLAEIFDGSECSQRGVEESEEVGDEDVVEEQVAISVRVLFAESVDEALEGVNVVGAEDPLGPDGQITPCQLRRPRELGSLGGWN